MSDAPTVVIADDHPIILVGVRRSLEKDGFVVVGEAADRQSAVREVCRYRPDVALLDVFMPGGGVEAAAAIAEEVPSTAVVMLTVSDEMTHVLGALRAGAAGYLLKDSNPDRLGAALCGVLRGETALPRRLHRRVLDEFRSLTATVGPGVEVGGVELTSREWEILSMLRANRTTTQIADALSLSPVTVRRHVSSAMAKLGVANRHEAVRRISRRSA